MEGRVWDRVDEFSDQFEKNDFIQVNGKASVYLGKMQLVVQELAPVDEQDVDLGDFLPVSARPADDMRASSGSRGRFTDPDLKALMQAFAADQEFMRGYCAAPAAKAMHHVYLGGLLEHSLAVADLADDVSRRYPGLSTGTCWWLARCSTISARSMSCVTSAPSTIPMIGKLLGHIVIGVEMIEEKIRHSPVFHRN